MQELAAHLQYVDSKKQKLRSQVKRLGQENSWLREELSTCQQCLQQSELRCITLEEEAKQLSFMNDLKKYDFEMTQVGIVVVSYNLSHDLRVNFAIFK